MWSIIIKQKLYARDFWKENIYFTGGLEFFFHYFKQIKHYYEECALSKSTHRYKYSTCRIMWHVILIKQIWFLRKGMLIQYIYIFPANPEELGWCVIILLQNFI